MPIVKFKTQEEIPEGLREEAKENGDSWEVNLVLKSKLDEFRDNNIKIAEERDDLKSKNESLAKIVGEDAEGFAEELEKLRSTAQQVEDGKLKGNDAIETEVTNRVNNMKASLEEQISALTKKNGELSNSLKDSDTRYKNSMVDRYITDAVLREENGVQSSALADIISRARGTFRVNEEGEVVAMKGDGVILYGADGTSPMTADEWIGSLKTQAPHFFKGNTGGSAGGNDGKKYPNGMTEEQFNKLPASQRLKYANEKKVA